MSWTPSCGNVGWHHQGQVPGGRRKTRQPSECPFPFREGPPTGASIWSSKKGYRFGPNVEVFSDYRVAPLPGLPIRRHLPRQCRIVRYERMCLHRFGIRRPLPGVATVPPQLLLRHKSPGTRCPQATKFPNGVPPGYRTPSTARGGSSWGRVAGWKDTSDQSNKRNGPSLCP